MTAGWKILRAIKISEICNSVNESSKSSMINLDFLSPIPQSQSQSRVKLIKKSCHRIAVAAAIQPVLIHIGNCV